MSRAIGQRRLRPPAATEVNIRLGDTEILKEGVVHLAVVMLTGVNKAIGNALMLDFTHCRNYRSYLDEVRPGSRNDCNFHP